MVSLLSLNGNRVVSKATVTELLINECDWDHDKASKAAQQFFSLRRSNTVPLRVFQDRFKVSESLLMCGDGCACRAWLYSRV